jgi:hypothetical protein
MGNQRNRLNAVDTATRRAKLVNLVRDGRYTWEQIAEQLDYSDAGAACKDYSRILKARQEELAQTLDDQRAAQLEGLMEIRRVAVEVMRRPHPFIQGGRIVRDGNTDDEPGDPLYDDGPSLAAIDRIAKIDAQIAQLLGLNAPTRVESDGQLTVIVEGVDLEGLT